MRRIIQHFKKADRQNAQGLAEFALVLPIFLLLVFGVIEIGWLVYFYSAVFTSSRDAARYGAGAGTSVTSGTTYSRDCAGIRARAKQSGTIIKIADADVSIYYDHGPDSSGNSTSIGHCNCPASEQLAPGETSCTVYNSNLQLGDRVIVKVTKNAKLVFPVFKNTTIPISSKSYRTVISGVSLSPTQTIVSSTSQGPTAVPTATPVPTSTPNCPSLYSFGNIWGAGGYSTTLNIGTNPVGSLTLTEFQAMWTGTGSVRLNSVTIGGSSIYSGSAKNSIDVTNLTFAYPLNYAELDLVFNGTISNGQVSLIELTFTNGCTFLWQPS